MSEPYADDEVRFGADLSKLDRVRLIEMVHRLLRERDDALAELKQKRRELDNAYTSVLEEAHRARVAEQERDGLLIENMLLRGVGDIQLPERDVNAFDANEG